MAHEIIRGFVLREVSLGEADRLLDILTADRGLVTAYARGARRAKSPLIGATQIFSLADFTVFAYKGRLSIDHADLIESFQKLRDDLDRLVCAAHLAEVLHDLVRDDLSGVEIYTLWAYACHNLQAHPDPFLVAHVAQLRALSLSGFLPNLSTCQICGHSIIESAWFDFEARSLVCLADGTRIAGTAGRLEPVSAAAIACLRYIQSSPDEKLFAFRLTASVRQEICRFSSQYLTVTMEKAYQKLAMLDHLNDSL
jgi:DNA repair protein RecO (recombination protein O)